MCRAHSGLWMAEGGEVRYSNRETHGRGWEKSTSRAVVGAVCVVGLRVQERFLWKCGESGGAGPAGGGDPLSSLRPSASCGIGLCYHLLPPLLSHPSLLPWGLAFALLSVWNVLPFSGFLSFFSPFHHSH